METFTVSVDPAVELVGYVRIKRTDDPVHDAEGVRQECRALEADMLKELGVR